MTFSINTNNSAMAALESLRSTATDLSTAEKAVSTGLMVGQASDNPAIYSIAQQMDGNIAGLSAVSSSLSFGAQVVATASSASTSVINTLQTLQNSITQAGQTGINITTMQTQVANALNQINTFARNSTFNGINLLTTASDAGTTVTSGNLNIVDGLQGTTLSVQNQATSTSAGAKSLTDALGLTSGMGGAANMNVLATGTAVADVSVVQNILTANSGGVNIGLSSSLAASSFSNGANVILTNGDGSTTTFEFDASGTAATATDTTGTGSAKNNVVVVLVDSTTETSNEMIGDLVNSMNANGYNAAVQNDGSVNVTGQGVKASTASDPGIKTGTGLTASEAAITTIQSAITTMTNIAATLGNTTTQITGMQTFTSDLSDALTSGVGALTDADLSAESAKLTSLQTKQSLAIQSLSIANSQSQSLLSLFR